MELTWLHPLRRASGSAVWLLLAACVTAAPPRAQVGGQGAGAQSQAAQPGTQVPEAEVRRILSVLAADSMEGRATGAPGSAKAARFIAAEMQKAGLTPAGDSGFFQRVPVRKTAGRGGRPGVQRMASWAAWDSLSPEMRDVVVNVVGTLRGQDPVLRDSVVLMDAHYDHLGIGAPVNGDSIFNGADDDASGTTAVIVAARVLAAEHTNRRTIIFAATTGEEGGLVGTNWYIAHPVAPLASMSSNLEVEMIGRPDPYTGGAGRAWLTGYERSTMGEIFARAGLAVTPDPRPSQRFFTRSDNAAFARAGIVAHTLSTFNLHTDYHQPSDEVSKVDFAHMTAVCNIAVAAVRILARDAAPQWLPGGNPAAAGAAPAGAAAPGGRGGGGAGRGGGTAPAP